MRFDRVRLANFKPYADTDLRLTDGVTVIHGLNGSGKSSLLEACFFALYGSKALEGTLDDVITNGEEEAEIDLWFTHDDGEYHIHRRLRRSGERVTTAKCTLEGPGDPVDGARDVRLRVTELLRMDSEAFVNCAYVRQGEVNKLINATPGQRQDMIDDLLQLGKLEEYRERAGDARLGVNDVLADKRGRLSELQSQVEAKEDADLHERLNTLQTKLANTGSKIDHYEKQRERARASRDDAQAKLDSYEDKRTELDSLASDIESLETDITDTERERDAHQKKVRSIRERIGELEGDVADLVDASTLETADEAAIDGRLDELDERESALNEELNDLRMQVQAFENQSTNLGEKATENAERADEKRQRATELDDGVEEATANLTNRREMLDRLDDEIESLVAAFERADADVEAGDASSHLAGLREERSERRDDLEEVRTTLNTVRQRVDDAEQLLDAGKCPECGQPVADSPHVEGLDEDRERIDELEATLETHEAELDDIDARIEEAESLVKAETELAQKRSNRDNVSELVEQREESLDEKREQAARLREEADDLESTASDLREVADEKAAEAAELRTTVEEREAERETQTAARDRLERIESLRGEIDDAKATAQRHREKRESLAELNDERRERLAEKRDRRAELREEVDDEQIEAARASKTKAENYIEQVADELDSLAERRDELQGHVGGVKQDIAQLEELREQRDAVAERVDALESLHEETEELEAMYGDLRAELRQRNVESLERMLNETFDLVYGNDAYSRIRLDGEYELTVFQKDGQPLEPEQLSGGERALFNLSLRCAIYRLLAEGIDGAAPMPPLILDEPTVFLDAGHVSRLVDLVEEMRSLGVRQIIIVSHDDELVGAADELVTVEKNATTNRSSVHREDSASLAASLVAEGDD